jgi:hypothetical protein
MQQSIAGRRCSVERHDSTWCFVFGGGAVDGCTVTTTSWWRIISGGRIAHSVADDGQLFGLPAPVNGLERSDALLSGVFAVSTYLEDITSDLRIEFERGIRLDIMNSSCGYESWAANFRQAENDITLIGSGGGELNFVSTPVNPRPQVVRGHGLTTL